MRRLCLPCEVLFGLKSRTKCIDISAPGDDVPTWLSNLVWALSTDWWRVVMDRDTPTRTAGTFLLGAVVEDANEVTFCRPFGEQGLTYIVLRGPKGERELEPGCGRLAEVVAQGIVDRGANIVEGAGVISGRIETLGMPSVWNSRWNELAQELILSRVRNIEPGATRA